MEETLDSLTQGASLFLDPAGAQVGEQVQGEEGIAYADLDLNACVEPKQFHDVVGYYQRYDIFDVRVNRSRQGPETAFQQEGAVLSEQKQGSINGMHQQEASRPQKHDHGHGVGGLRIT